MDSVWAYLYPLLGMWTSEYFQVRGTCLMRIGMLGFSEKAENSSEII